jgi:hypothetical protein
MGEAMRVLVVVSTLLVMSSSVLHAEETIEKMGLGLQSCAQFAKSYKANPEPAEAMYFSWAAGFMTGMNLTAAMFNNNMRNLGAMAFEEKQLFMRQFCDQNPLKTYQDGVFKLYLALPASQSKR